MKIKLDPGAYIPVRAHEELTEREAADYERGLLALWPELKKGAKT